MSENKGTSGLYHIERAHRLEQQISEKDQVIGSLNKTIQILENKEKIDAKKEADKQPKVQITSREEKRDRWGDYYGTTYEVRQTNMEEAAELIAEKLNKNQETELEGAKEMLKKKDRDIEDMKHKSKLRSDEYKRDLETIRNEREEQIFEANKKVAKENSDLKHKISDLEEELTKVREDKTDELVEKERKEEITKLKARIKSLEREVKRLSVQGWLGKVWDRISNRKARVEALKQVEEEKLSSGGWSPSFPWIFRF